MSSPHRLKRCPDTACVSCRDEDAAARALQGLTGRFYAGRPILVEFSPVTDFREATCRQYEENTCTRGGYCNFMHLRPISKCARAAYMHVSSVTCKPASLMHPLEQPP